MGKKSLPILREQGVTLIEAMVVVSISAVLLTIGVPSMIDLLSNVRRDSQQASIVLSLNYARNEAIKRGQRVTVCPGDSAGCLGAPVWDAGWIVFTDTNGNSVVDPDDNLLAIEGPLASGHSLRSGRERINFQATGYSLGSNDTLRLCDSRGTGSSRRVVVNALGRVRISATSPSCP